jgi:pilus assembly protein CpaE
MAKIPAILVIDQDVKARYEVKRLVKQSHFNIAGEAAFGTEAVSTAVELEPDVVLLGMSQPVMRSLNTVESILNALPQTPVIVYSFEPEIDVARKAMVAGARDFVVMPASAEEVGKSIIAVLESEERRQMRLRGQTLTWGAQGTIVTVFGPKGGVGKTTVAVNLAVALVGETGQSVALVDGDYGFGDVAGMLDLPAERTIVDLAREAPTITRETLPKYLTAHKSGLNVVAGPAQTLAWRGVKPDEFRKAIDLLSKSHDIVVIDTAGTLNDVTLAALEAASLVLWIVTTDFASVRDSLRALEALSTTSYPLERIRILVNDLAMRDGVRPGTIEEALGREIFWRVPFDQRVRQGAQAGEPVVTGHPSAAGARNLKDLARTVVGIKPPREKLLDRMGLFRRRARPRVSRETMAKETEGK